MTYGRARFARDNCGPDDAAARHSAELVRGDLRAGQGPLIRPSATFSPGGEGPQGVIAMEAHSTTFGTT